jgi:hypothetical protein
MFCTIQKKMPASAQATESAIQVRAGRSIITTRFDAEQSASARTS